MPTGACVSSAVVGQCSPMADRIVIGVLVWLSYASASAQTVERTKPEVPPREREMAMALSAAPPRLRDQAAVYVLERSGFIKIRESHNGFSCIVNRDHPLNLKPTCYDAEGSETILPKGIQVGAWLMEGRPVSEINTA